MELNEFIKEKNILKIDIKKSEELNYIKKDNFIIYSNKLININTNKYNEIKNINNLVILKYNEKNNKEEIKVINIKNKLELCDESINKNDVQLEYYNSIICENFSIIFNDDYVKQKENNDLYKFENNKEIIYIKHKKILDDNYFIEIFIKRNYKNKWFYNKYKKFIQYKFKNVFKKFNKMYFKYLKTYFLTINRNLKIKIFFKHRQIILDKKFHKR